MSLEEALTILRERHLWLCARIVAKQGIHWNTEWDERERDALYVAIQALRRD